ncbi:MAG: hypothetical protein P4L27_11005 [Ignavibacteriaceae bacterium]|nr:hypothetical protein [Ignavibacteriaceae bacterium]
MNTFIKTLLLILFGSYFTFSQVLENYESNFNTLFDKKAKVNPYYFGHNPAWLKNEVSNEYLDLKSEVNDETGNFKKFTDPGDIRNYIISATGKKLIDTTQIFRGSFAFQRVENNNWQWLFTRDYATGSPFLIGDSTTGNTRLNGIKMSAEYAASVIDALDLGFSINYYIDDGLKMAHPRPTSKDREINFSTGAAYQISDNLSLGIQGSVYDNEENIDYSQDPGALLTEITLIKFRGYDYPNVFKKTSESRYTYNNGYSTGINLMFKESSSFTMTAFATGGFNQINVRDGGDSPNPIVEGLYKNNYLNSGLVSLFKLNNSTFLSLLYNLNLSNDWAEFPTFNVLYSKNWFTEHSLLSGIEYSFNNNLTAGLEAGIKYNSNNFNDYYSIIYANNKAITLMLNLGMKINWSNKLASFISAGINSDKSSNNNLDYSNPSYYFTGYRIKDLYYYQSNFNQYLFNLITAYSPGFGGEFLINLKYANAIPGNLTPFANQNRTNSTIALEYRVAAY